MAADCGIPIYLPASWKGVPFEVESTDDSFGRRGDSYEYPLSETIAYKDLGKKARKFKLKGWIIGGAQLALTAAMAAAAESPEPGLLMHPVFGPQLCACVDCKIAVQPHKENRRTKLDFEFLEAAESMAPFAVAATIGSLFVIGSNAIAVANRQAIWTPTQADQAVAAQVSQSLVRYLSPGEDEESWDAIDRLQRGGTTGESYRIFRDVGEPITDGTAILRIVHEDAAERLQAWNATVTRIAGTDPSPSIESLVLTARLALARDYSLTVAQTAYVTVGDALRDLDFVMHIYDEEESIAVSRCNDELTVEIRRARAAAARTILSNNIRLPGTATTDVDGVWPSLVVAHKRFADATRYEEIEDYNPTMNPYFMGREIVAPAA